MRKCWYKGYVMIGENDGPSNDFYYFLCPDAGTHDEALHTLTGRQDESGFAKASFFPHYLW